MHFILKLGTVWRNFSWWEEQESWTFSFCDSTLQRGSLCPWGKAGWGSWGGWDAQFGCSNSLKMFSPKMAPVKQLLVLCETMLITEVDSREWCRNMTKVLPSALGFCRCSTCSIQRRLVRRRMEKLQERPSLNFLPCWERDAESYFI